MSARKVHRYEGETLTITYDVTRCIHARECVHGARAVFDPDRRPWCDPDAASQEEEALSVIARCPSGALKAERKDGSAIGLGVPDENLVQITADGPLYVQGHLEMDGHAVGPRLALCRCGASRHKPFCDNQHREIGFSDTGAVAADPRHDVEATGEPLAINPTENGPYVLSGPVTIRASSGRIAFTGHRIALCRCGGSHNKPFCDGTHKTIGFNSSR